MGAGGKGSTSSQSVSIPPEVLARYNSINARAEDVASTPFVPYSQDPNAFVAPLTGSQRAGIQNVNAVQGMAQPSIDTGQAIVAEGLRQGAPLQQQAIDTIGGARGLGNLLYGGSLGTSAQGTETGKQLYGQSLNTSAQGTQAGRQLYGQSLNTSGQGLGAASNIYAQSLAAIPQAVNTGQQYAGLAGDYLSNGTQNVNAQQFSGEALQPFMSPYINSVVKAQQALQEQENAKQRSAMTGDAIRAGAFGGDRAGIAQAELGRQQSLANQATLANILQSGYGQAANQFSQQQGINLSADQANRVAQQYGAQQAAALGQQQYGQGLGAAQAAAGMGQSIYGMGAQQAGLQQQAAQGVGSQANQQAALQQQAAQGVGTQAQQQATMQQQAAQGLFGQAAQQAAVQQSSGQNLYNMGLGGGQAYAGLGVQGQNTALQGAQAQMGAGQMEQQTNQAGLSALYNQFLQQQGFPYQQAQFLGNIAMGTGALSGSTTQTTQPSFSDRRLKEDVKAVGETFDGQKIYSYRMKGENRPQLGLMAQEVEGAHPEAVGLAGGYKTVDYDKATEKAAKRGHFYEGGGVGGDGMGGMGEGGFGGSAADAGMDGSTGGDGDGSGNLYPQIAEALAAVASSGEPAAPVYQSPYARQTPLTFQSQSMAPSQSTAPTRNAFGFYLAPSTGAGQYSGSYGMPQSTGKMPQASGKGPSSSRFASGGRVGFADGGSAADYINMLGMSGTDLAKAQAAMYANAPWAGASGAGERIKHTLQAPKGGLTLPAPPRERPNAVQGAAGLAEGVEKLWNAGEKGAEGLGKLLGDKAPDMTQEAWDKLDPELFSTLFKADGGSVGEEDDDAPLGLYAPPGKGINIPDEKPNAKLATASGGGGGGGGKSPLGDVAAIGMMAAKFLPMLAGMPPLPFERGGAVTRHGYATDGAVDDTSPDVAAVLEAVRRQAKQPDSTLYDRIHMAESSGRMAPGIIGDGGRAAGPMQVHPAALADVNKRLGTNYTHEQMAADPKIGKQVGDNYLSMMLEQTGGDERKAAAAYNAGLGRVKAAEAAGGQNWEQHLPDSTRNNYLAKVFGGSRPGLAPPSREEAPAQPAIPSSIMAMMDTQQAEKPAAKERSFMDSLTSKDFLLPALSAIGSYMAAGAPTQAGALGAAVMGGTGAYNALQNQNIMRERVGITERQVALREEMERRKINAARAAAGLPPIGGTTQGAEPGQIGSVPGAAPVQPVTREAMAPPATSQGAQPPVPADAAFWANVDPQSNPSHLLQEAERYDEMARRASEAPEVMNPLLARATEFRNAARAIRANGMVTLKDGTTAPIPGHSQTQAQFEADKTRAVAKENAEHTMKEVYDDATGNTVLKTESEILKDLNPQPGAGSPTGNEPPVRKDTIVKRPEQEKIRLESQTKNEEQMAEMFAKRQTARERISDLKDIVQKYQTGAFAEAKADAIRWARAAGFDVKDTDMSNPAAFQLFRKNALKFVFDDAKDLGGRILLTEIEGQKQANADPTMEPQAVVGILGNMDGILNYEDAYYKDYMKWRKNNKNNAFPEDFDIPWREKNRPRTFIEQAKKGIAAKGVPVPANPAERVDGQAYIAPASGKKVYWDASTGQWHDQPIPKKDAP